MHRARIAVNETFVIRNVQRPTLNVQHSTRCLGFAVGLGGGSKLAPFLRAVFDVYSRAKIVSILLRITIATDASQIMLNDQHTRGFNMNWKKLLMVVLAVGALSFAAAPRAKAGVSVGIGFGFPVGYGYYGNGCGYPGYGYGTGILVWIRVWLWLLSASVLRTAAGCVRCAAILLAHRSPRLLPAPIPVRPTQA